MTTKEAIKKLMDLQHRRAVLGGMESLIVHDGSTAAPKGGAELRGEMLSMLSEQRYELESGEETGALLEVLRGHMDELTAPQRRMVEKLYRAYDETRAIPKALFMRFNRLMSDADVTWHEAKQKNDYPMFAPYLDEIVAVMREIAACVAPEMDAYDYWLDHCQEGMTRAVCDPFFARMAEALPPLIRRVASLPMDDSCVRGDFPKAQQEALAAYIMEIMHISPDVCSLCETEHPYTAPMTPDCIRMTTHYYEEDFSRSLFTMLHEGGHALYDMHVPKDMAYTVLGDLDYAAIHEGQSRFFENYVGRNQAFLAAIAPRLRELLPALGETTAEEIYRAVNACQPGLIRMDADELTYPMHIIVRYELEKKLFSGELSAKDLPAAWNGMYKELLGVDVPDDAHGVLQDSHWATGYIGYFPSYALGSAYGAQIIARMRGDFDVEACLAKADLSPVIAWLDEHIWKYATLLTPDEIMEKTFGGPFDPQYFIDYLTQKYSALYGLAPEGK